MPWKGKEEVIDCASSDKTHPDSGTDPEQSPYMSEIHVLKDDPNFEL